MTAVHLPKLGYSFAPFPHLSSPFAFPDKAGKQGNRAYMQALLPSRCKSSAESYDLSPTPPFFFKTKGILCHRWPQYLPRKKGACLFPLVCCAPGI